MTKEFVPFKDFTWVNFREFVPKTHLDYLAAGMEKHGLIVGVKGKAGRKIGGAANSIELGYEGSLIRQARMNAGLSQDQLGQMLGLSGGYVSFLENGKRKIMNKDSAMRLGDFLQSNGINTVDK